MLEMPLKEEIKVSVIIPVYNALPYLSQAIESITNQSLKDIEIICIDDGSTDGSYEVLMDYAQKDERIHVFKSGKQNQGAAITRNIGIKEAKGKYLSILDADDFFDLDMLEKTYECAESQKAEIIIYDGWKFDTEIGVDYYQVNFNVNTNLFTEDNSCGLDLNKVNGNIFSVTHGAAWNELYLKSFVDDNNLKFIGDYYPDDMVFVYTAIALANNVQIMKNRFVHYRQSTSNQTTNANKKIKIIYNGPQLIADEFKKRNIYDTHKTHILNFTLEYMRYWLGLLNDEKKFQDAYYILKDEYFEKLGVASVSSKDGIIPYLLEFRDAVYNYTAEEFLFHQLKQKEKIEFTKTTQVLRILKHLNECQNIVIYGAGHYGKHIHEILCLNHPYLAHINICAWVDKNYRNIGYPVQAPKVIGNLCFDHIVIAIKEDNLYNEIREYLLSMGISEKKIIHISQV